MTKCEHCNVYTPNNYGVCPQCGAPLVPFDACYVGQHGCQRIVINTCYGGFHPSAKAIMRWAELSGIEMHCVEEINFMGRKWDEIRHYREINPFIEKEKFFYTHFSTKPLKADGTFEDGSNWYYDEYEFRCDPNFVCAVEELGSEASDHTVSELKVVEIPDEVEWTIQEYDGIEWIAEKHRTWD